MTRRRQAAEIAKLCNISLHTVAPDALVRPKSAVPHTGLEPPLGATLPHDERSIAVGRGIQGVWGSRCIFRIYRDASGVTGRRAEERFAVLAMEWFWNQRDQDDEFVNWLRFLGCEILW